MDKLLDLILTPLDRGLADQIRQRFEITRADPDTDELHALQDALQNFPDESFTDDWWLDPARCRWWLALHVDWKAYSEVEWQVQAIARTLGLEVNFGSKEAVEWDGYFDQLDLARAAVAQTLATPVSLLGKLRQGLENFRRGIRPVSTPEPLSPTLKPPSNTPTMDVLGEASEWLRERGYELLYLGTGGDEYVAVPIQLDLLAQAQAAAECVSISTYLV